MSIFQCCRYKHPPNKEVCKEKCSIREMEAKKAFRKKFPDGVGMDDTDDHCAWVGFYECWKMFN